ncbi:MAG: hypothetical protein P9M15_05420 [Candidatus Electryoneaceae bacterium]|nr:hypothetical protein [Candidatus Electryoneaceae bacterium]
MKELKPTRRNLKRIIVECLKTSDWNQAFRRIQRLPLRTTINVLLAHITHPNNRIKSRAATAIGILTAQLADQDMESARIIVRRLIWNLTEESGNCIWGAPETIGEILANHPQLAQEYCNILISFIIPDGNYLEYEPQQLSAVIGIRRLAQDYPDLMRDAIPYLTALLNSDDKNIKNAAEEALLLIKTGITSP